MKTLATLVLLASSAFAQTAPASCSNATLSLIRSLTLTGRNVNTSGVVTGVFQAVGSAAFDGNGNVTFALNTSSGSAVTWTGNYTLGANCVGTLNVSAGDPGAQFTLIAYASGDNFTLTGYDTNFVYTGSGGTPPSDCLAASLSGAYAFTGTGFEFFNGSALAGPAVLGGVNAISGLLQFDGVSALTANWTVSTSSASTPDSLTGTYTPGNACTATGTLSDSSGTSYNVAFAITSDNAANFDVLIANAATEPTTISVIGAGHSTFTNPGLAVELAAGAGLPVPPGSLFSIYGSNMTSGQGQATGFPLPTKVQNATVTINGEAVPLYYVDKTLINAQMPLDVTPGVATLVVSLSGTPSNSVAVNVSPTAAPGVFIYGNNHTVAQNLPSYTENSESASAPVGSTIVVYFTGGGPVEGQGSLQSGQATPAAQFGITEDYSITIGGVQANIDYIGLVPTAVGGFYQANVVVPQVSSGDHPLILTINGKASNTSTISIK